MKFLLGLTALFVLLVVGLVVRDCMHPCLREGEPYTYYVLINHVMVPVTGRDCIERAP